MELVKVNTTPAIHEVEFAPFQETSDIHFMAANTNPVSHPEVPKSPLSFVSLPITRFASPNH